MFKGCFELKHLDLSNFNTSNVTSMGDMFNKCYKLKEIKGIKNFKMNNSIFNFGIFQECFELKNLEELISLFNINTYHDLEPEIESNSLKKEITIHFTSINQRIKYSMTCYNLDIFSTILEKLYQAFPQLRNKNMYFLVNGNVVDKSLNLEQNKIKDGAQILIYIY